jgi:endonuclease/exonuclease/phosphatase family metal-dependent hydrolase
MLRFKQGVYSVFITSLVSFNGFVFTTQAIAEPITVATYNIHGAPLPPQLEEWINTRRHLVFQSIETKQPDFMGFQEAYARNTNSEGITQQSTLGELFEDTKWQFLSWEAENEYNMNPIIVNTDRFDIVATGVFVVNVETFLGTEGWKQFYKLHLFFHQSSHYFEPERYVSWVVADDSLDGGRIVFLTTHYETFIGWNNHGSEYDKLFLVFSDLVNSVFGYISEQVLEHVQTLNENYGALHTVIGGDFETPDPQLPAQHVYEDEGYVETWRHINGNAMRPTMGIDNLFVHPDLWTINDSYYDQESYTNDASDHKPLYADVTVIQIFCSADVDNSGEVNVTDLLAVIDSWGSCDMCSADINGDGVVDVSDLLVIIGSWGPC